MRIRGHICDGSLPLTWTQARVSSDERLLVLLALPRHALIELIVRRRLCLRIALATRINQNQWGLTPLIFQIVHASPVFMATLITLRGDIPAATVTSPHVFTRIGVSVPWPSISYCETLLLLIFATYAYFPELAMVMQTGVTRDSAVAGIIGTRLPFSATVYCETWLLFWLTT